MITSRSPHGIAGLLVALAATIAPAGCKLDRREASDGVSSREAPVTTTAHAEHGVEIRALLIQPTGRDQLGEWIELRNTGRVDVRLDGWRLDSGADSGFVIPDSTLILAGGRLDLGRSLKPHHTGGVRVRIQFTGLRLDDVEDWLVLRDREGRTIDSVAWRGSIPDMPLTHRPPGRTGAERLSGTGSVPDLPPAPTDSGSPTQRP